MKTAKVTPLEELTIQLRAERLNQPKVTLREAQEQAKRVMEAGRRSPLRFVRSANGESKTN